MNSAPLPILWNDQAGSARTRSTIATLSADSRATWERPRSEAETRTLLRQLRERGAPRIGVCGGDGTLRLAVQELRDSRTELALLPGGSGNDLARAARIPLDPKRALELALNGTARPTDLGVCGERCFVTVAGVGLDGAVLEFLEGRSAIWRGAWIYPFALLLTLARFRPPRVRLSTDRERFEGEAMLVVVANGSQFGGGMRIGASDGPSSHLRNQTLSSNAKASQADQPKASSSPRPPTPKYIL